jgi:hypothetical protein
MISWFSGCTDLTTIFDLIDIRINIANLSIPVM